MEMKTNWVTGLPKIEVTEVALEKLNEEKENIKLERDELFRKKATDNTANIAKIDKKLCWLNFYEVSILQALITGYKKTHEEEKLVGLNNRLFILQKVVEKENGTLKGNSTSRGRLTPSLFSPPQFQDDVTGASHVQEEGEAVNDDDSKWSEDTFSQ